MGFGCVCLLFRVAQRLAAYLYQVGVTQHEDSIKPFAFIIILSL